MTYRILLSALIAFSPATAFADPWQILGPRAMGMGGAGVAMADGAVAQYWNPAALAEMEGNNSRWGLQIPVAGRVEFTGGVLNDANTLGDIASQFQAIQSAQKSGTVGAMDATKVGSFYKGLVTISDMNQPGKGILGNVNGGANFKIGKFAFSVNNFTSLGAAPFIDTKNIGLGAATGLNGVSFIGANTIAPGGTNGASATQIANAIGAGGYANLNALTGGALAAGGIANAAQLGNALVNFASTNGQSVQQISDAATQISQNAGAAAPLIASAASGNPYTNNQSNLTVRGGSFTELAMGYGRPLLLPGLMVGGNVKAIVGRVAYARFNVLQNSSGSTNVFKNYSTAQTIQPGLDLGALWRLDRILPKLPFKPRVGIVARNINDPRFTEPGAAIDNGESSRYALNGQMRMGAAISPFNFWHVATEWDLTENNTPVSGYKSRMWGLGTEVNVFNRSWINIPLRAGLMKNLADSGSKLGYTAGFGINLIHFTIDAAGSVSSDTTQIKSGQKLPSNAAVSVQLGLMF